jgi:cold shock protein
MPTGTVRFFNDVKGFGFITPDTGGSDLFAHQADVQSSGHHSLKQEQKVEYDVRAGPKGPAATNIRVL